MIKLIVGNKGSGKTKAMIEMINKAAQTTTGNVVCVEKGMKLTYDISHSVRLIDIENYEIAGFDAFFGFLSGILAGNYDITDVYIDGILKIGGKDLDGLGALLAKVERLIADSKILVVFTVSADEADLPESVKNYM
ncbi:MAG: hypothetical protein ACLSAP_11015 [Oscillospiraceae bacterium]